MVQAAFIRDVLEKYPNERLLLLSHVRELLCQNADKLRRLYPEASVGMYSAGLGSRETGAQITVAGIQSCYRRAHEFGEIALVIIDEAHTVPKQGEGMYRQFLRELAEANPYLKVIGMSATPYRMKSGYIHKGEGRIFTDIAYEAKVLDLINDGYLCPLISKVGETEADLSQVHIRGGEYIQSELEAVMNTDLLVSQAVDEMIKLCSSPHPVRKKWLVFCAGVRHADHVCEMLNACDIPTACVTGKTSKEERDEALRDFRTGHLKAITNVNVLTTGFDAPCIDAVIMLRPTRSPGLFYQMVGRGLRIDEAKKNTLVLDFAGNIMRHGPIDQIRVIKKKGGPAPLKTCPECRTLVPLACAACAECEHEFPAPKPKLERPKHEAEPSELPILSANGFIRPTWIKVDRESYSIHRKPGKPPSLRVKYHCGLLNLNRPGFSRDRFS